MSTLTTVVDLKYELLDRIGTQFECFVEGTIDEQELFDYTKAIMEEIVSRHKERVFNYVMAEMLRQFSDDKEVE